MALFLQSQIRVGEGSPENVYAVLQCVHKVYFDVSPDDTQIFLVRLPELHPLDAQLALVAFQRLDGLVEVGAWAW